MAAAVLKVKSQSSDVSQTLFTTSASPHRAPLERWLRAEVDRSCRHGVFTVTVNLMPELAELLLENNPHNRNISLLKISQYARDIRAGVWLHNGATIIVADTGELNDGQNRCLAVIRAGQAIVTEMTFGVPRDSRSTVDIGMKRSIGQHLGMAGYLNAKHLGHAIAIILTFQAHKRVTQSPNLLPTNQEIMAWAETNPEMPKHLVKGAAVYRNFKASAGLFSALHYLMTQRSETDADRFFDSLISGENLSQSSPVYRLRAMLIRESQGKARLPETEVAALAIKAWNHFRHRRLRRALSWRTEGPTPESFPIPE